MSILKFAVSIFCFLLLFISACDVEVQLSDVEWKNKENLKTDNLKYVTTFKIDSCEKITIRYHKKMSDPGNGIAPKTKEIRDKATISQLLQLIRALPDTGEIMKKPGDVSVLQVILTLNDNETEFFAFYGETIKTTDTSFYSKHPAEEKVIYNMLMKLLAE
ncbi:MAG: hypothetical protein WAQ28_20865 [Bacteroidia bacterium]|jgi:hypothetical protein